MRSYRIYQVDAFTTERFRGNPAGVVPEADGLDEASMQLIARELNNPETAFILPPSGPDHDAWVRFFTPSTEVPSCGHATVAAHYVRAVEGTAAPGTFSHRIGIGVLPITIEPVADDYKVVMTQGRPEVEDPLDDSIAGGILEALGLEEPDRDPRCPVQVATTGHSKVMVGIRSRRRLDGLAPDLARLKAISGEIGCNGYFVFTRAGEDGGLDVHGRMFAPAIGIPEDPATGNANGPLGAYLVHHGLASLEDGRLSFAARQGEAMGRPGTVEVSVRGRPGKPEEVKVSGRAVIAFRTEIRL